MAESEEPAERVRAHVLVTGRVQGVFFRQQTQRRAMAAGVSGWVRNRSDGAVEAVFEGDVRAVESMIAWCRSGPPHARVGEVSVEWEKPQGEVRFSVRP